MFQNQGFWSWGHKKGYEPQVCGLELELFSYLSLVMNFYNYMLLKR